MAAACGTIRIAARCRPPYDIAELHHTRGRNSRTRQAPVTTPPTDRRVRPRNGCRLTLSRRGPLGGPGLRDVTHPTRPAPEPVPERARSAAGPSIAHPGNSQRIISRSVPRPIRKIPGSATENSPGMTPAVNQSPRPVRLRRPPYRSRSASRSLSGRGPRSRPATPMTCRTGSGWSRGRNSQEITGGHRESRNNYVPSRMGVSRPRLVAPAALSRSNLGLINGLSPAT